MSFVTVKDLSKSYKTIKVFENLDFSIEKGEFLTLLGPSGCGKSTLLRCIAGLEDINSGEIYVEDKEISKLSPKNRDISMVFQSYALFPNMTVRENIAFGLKMKKIPEKVYKEKIDRMISLVELEGKEDSYPHQLSGGQQQRVALARALAMEPKILLLDEPLSALDAKIRRSLRLQIRNIQKQLNITTIFVTHDQEEALIVSDRILVMDKGRIVKEGTPREIYNNPGNEFVAGFIGNYNLFTRDEIKDLASQGLDGELFAIRPESIYIYEDLSQIRNQQVICFEGIVEDSVILGNILRSLIKVKNKNIIVDMLNREENYFEKGRKVQLYTAINGINKIK